MPYIVLCQYKRLKTYRVRRAKNTGQKRGSMEKVYIIVFKDNCIQLFSNELASKKENFQKDARCFSCNAKTEIEDIRDFVYVMQCPEKHGYHDKIFKKEW
jgi:hypothetical protein